MQNNTLEIARQILAQNERLLNLLEADADKPAKVTRPARKATKAAKPQVKAAKATKVTHLTKGNRAAFVKAAPWAKGLSTRVIAAMCVEDASLVPAGWAIGEGYTALVS